MAGHIVESVYLALSDIFSVVKVEDIHAKRVCNVVLRVQGPYLITRKTSQYFSGSF